MIKFFTFLANAWSFLSRLFGGGDKARDDAYERGKLEAENTTLEGQYADALKQGQAWADAPHTDADFDKLLDDAAARARAEGRP